MLTTGIVTNMGTMILLFSLLLEPVSQKPTKPKAPLFDKPKFYRDA